MKLENLKNLDMKKILMILGAGICASISNSQEVNVDAKFSSVQESIIERTEHDPDIPEALVSQTTYKGKFNLTGFDVKAKKGLGKINANLTFGYDQMLQDFERNTLWNNGTAVGKYARQDISLNAWLDKRLKINRDSSILAGAGAYRVNNLEKEVGNETSYGMQENFSCDWKTDVSGFLLKLDYSKAKIADFMNKKWDLSAGFEGYSKNGTKTILSGFEHAGKNERIYSLKGYDYKLYAKLINDKTSFGLFYDSVQEDCEQARNIQKYGITASWGRLSAEIAQEIQSSSGKTEIKALKPESSIKVMLKAWK
jgi:hypothetical protein